MKCPTSHLEAGLFDAGPAASEGRSSRRHLTAPLGFGALVAGLLLAACPLQGAPVGPPMPSTWPQAYVVRRHDPAGQLVLSTPYYTVQHDLKQGGVIAAIRLTHGKATNLLVRPIETRLQTDDGTVLTDLHDRAPRVSHRREGLTEIVTVEARLARGPGAASDIQVTTVCEYRWGYVKIRKEFRLPENARRVRAVCPLATVLSPNLTDYGYREGTTESEGAPAFSFGSNRWGKMRAGPPADSALETPFVPRSIMFADPGVEGLEWFVGSDLAQWDLQLTGKRGEGLCRIESSQSPPGVGLSIAALRLDAAVTVPASLTFGYYLGVPLIEGRASSPWFHSSFNRNRGEWVSPDQIQGWAEQGFQTVHCHNDGDYYDDGLFWRDGSYPPYPDMDKYDQVIARCHEAGIRVATYFSNKELHRSTPEFQQHGLEWGRMNAKGNLQHNLYRGTNEFGTQMCLRSGWLDFLRFSIDRVLKHHRLDGVYYDWNVALLCGNGAHEGKPPGTAGTGHWDIDELLELMEWTRVRVGPSGLVIVHNTTTPMFVMENFANHVVANEWGYGKWQEPGPALAELPLEWNLAGARSRGVISYGQLDAQSPRRLHRVFALEALLGGVTPWPASPETFDLYPVLKPIGDLTTCRFADWRNAAVTLAGRRCGAAVYSRPREAFILVANLDKEAQEVGCRVRPDQLPYPLRSLKTAVRLGGGTDASRPVEQNLNVRALTRDGVRIALPADSAVLIRVR